MEADDRFPWWDELVHLPGVRRGREEGVMAVDIREKLWRFVKEAIHSWESDVNMSDHITDNLIARGVTVQEWTSVSERLPQNFVSVLGYMTDAGEFPPVRECYTVGNAFFFPALGDVHPVSHWCEMPQPPKGG